MAIKSLHNRSQTLALRLKNRYLLQAGLIGVAVILGIVITHLLLRQLLVREALAREADYFWPLIEENPQVVLATTKNLRAFLLPRDRSLLPNDIDNLQKGYQDYHFLDDLNVAYLSEGTEGKRLLLLFNRSEVDSLVLLFGILPLSLALIFLYASLFFSFRSTKKMLSPAIHLAEKIRNTDLLAIDKSYFSSANPQFNGDEEVITIASAISELTERLELFVERERNFTRDVSHELRSSITVITMAAELLTTMHLSSEHQLLVKKIIRASKDMEELTEFFLILAREEYLSHKEQSISLPDIIQEEVDKLTLVSNQKQVPIIINIHNPSSDPINIKSSRKVLSILIGNLLRNALLYTDKGHVEISLNDREICIADTGIGISEDKLQLILDEFVRDAQDHHRGFGVGLSIVKRLCDSFQWKLFIESERHVGTVVKLHFVS